MPKTLLLCALLAAAPSPSLKASQAGAKRTNVLFIIADDLNRSPACYGNLDVKSPNVDRLAARALRFERAYCQYPVCSPSRVSFLSGRRPEHTGKFGNTGPSRTPLLKHAVFMPQYFKEQGYFTARVGKVFHIGCDVPECWNVTEEGTPGNQVIYQPSEVEKLGLQASVVANGRLDGDTGEGGHWTMVNAAEGKLIDPNTSRRIVELLDQAVRQQKAFFIACGFRRPHLPWMAPEEYFGLYDPASLRLHDPGPRPSGGSGKPAASEASRRASLRAYYAAISFMDRQLGRVLDAMDRLDLWRNTVVVMIGDNGYHLGTRGGYWGKGLPYEESCGVPLLVAAPGRQAGRVCSRVVEFLDLYPTLVDLCGLPRRNDLDGRSLRPLLDNPSIAWDHAAFSITARQNQPATLAVSTDRFRYIEYIQPAKPPELYDLESDPHEANNLAQDPAHANVLARMKKQAERHRASNAAISSNIEAGSTLPRTN